MDALADNSPPCFNPGVEGGGRTVVEKSGQILVPHGSLLLEPTISVVLMNGPENERGKNNAKNNISNAKYYSVSFEYIFCLDA